MNLCGLWYAFAYKFMPRSPVRAGCVGAYACHEEPLRRVYYSHALSQGQGNISLPAPQGFAGIVGPTHAHQVCPSTSVDMSCMAWSLSG